MHNREVWKVLDTVDKYIQTSNNVKRISLTQDQFRMIKEVCESKWFELQKAPGGIMYRGVLLVPMGRTHE